jgi:hypothetical protein
MLQEVQVNGFTYYADVNNQILYADRDRKSGSPFHFLTKNERQQVENSLRFPKTKTTEE